MVSITVDIMHRLRGKFSQCTIHNNHLQTCGYHESRQNCDIWGIQEGGVDTASLTDEISVGQLKISKDILSLFKEMSGQCNVAGGWYLIREQREWLFNRMVEILSKSESECRVLVSGIAGYAHFFSYMKILTDAAGKAKFDLSRLSVDVVDICPTPLYIIKEIYENEKLFTGIFNHTVRTHGVSFKPSKRNIRFLKQELENIRKVKINLICQDIKLLPDSISYKYNVVTEHFLTSMMEKEMQVISKLVATYSKIIVTGGHLLMASGFPDKQFVKSLLDIYRENGLLCCEEDIKKVWDPYGLPSSTLAQILLLPNTPHFIPLENMMVDFHRE